MVNRRKKKNRIVEEKLLLNYKKLKIGKKMVKKRRIDLKIV